MRSLGSGCNCNSEIAALFPHSAIFLAKDVDKLFVMGYD